MTFQIEAPLFMWEGVVFWFKGCSHHFYPKKRLWLKGFSKNGQFLINVPQGINQGDFRVSQFWDLCFWSLKRFGRFEAIASLDAYQIIKYQTLRKLIIFYCLISEEFEKKILNQEFYDQLPEQVWSKGSFDFSKIEPLGVPSSLIQMVSKWKGVFIEMDLLPIVITNSFKIQNQTFEKHFIFIFYFFCVDFMIMKFIPF